MALSYEAARGLLREVAPLLENIEEPVASLHEMDQLASEFSVRTSAHCTDLDAMIAYPRVDAVPTLDACGGISGVRRLTQVLGARGRRVWLRSHAESGVGWAAIVHLGMSTPELARPAQSLVDLSAEDLILGDRWDVCLGGVCAPPSAGLGVAIDRAALEACHELYLEQGEAQAFPPALRRTAPL
jgi:L-alanine-DL-glutamate epimerase-like enolase superfamily enzyme